MLRRLLKLNMGNFTFVNLCKQFLQTHSYIHASLISMLGPAYYAQAFIYNAFEDCFQNMLMLFQIIMSANFIILNKQTALLELIND